MVDGGPEFDNNTVHNACAACNVELQVVPGYSPWINGLVEGMNAKLLGRLKRLCAPDLGEDDHNMMDLPASWPDHLEAAVEEIKTSSSPNSSSLLTSSCWDSLSIQSVQHQITWRKKCQLQRWMSNRPM
jgi:hypothetical protein